MKKHKHLSVRYSLLAFTLLITSGFAFAECGGCCSGHKGVVCDSGGATKCGDGTPLSASCAKKGCDKCSAKSSKAPAAASVPAATSAPSTPAAAASAPAEASTPAVADAKDGSTCAGCCAGHKKVVCENGITKCGDGSALSESCSKKGCDKCATAAKDPKSARKKK